MIGPDKRKAVFLLHQEGMPLREISRRLGLGRNSVRRIIAQEGQMPTRSFTPPIDPELLRQLHQECDGYLCAALSGLTATVHSLILMTLASGTLAREC